MPNLITIAQCRNDIEAELLRSRLERAGIRCRLANQQIRNATGGAMTGYHAVYIWVQVAAPDEERARRIAAEKPGALTPDEEQDMSALAEAAGRCPACGSENVDFAEVAAEQPGPTGSASVLEGRCAACGHRWLLE